MIEEGKLNPQKITGEKIEFLQRNEIKTMEKDLKKLREAESEVERKKIAEDEKKRKEEEQKKIEEQRKRNLEEEKRKEEQKKIEEDQRKKEEEAKIRLHEERKKTEEQIKIAEERRGREEEWQKKIEDQKRKIEEEKLQLPQQIKRNAEIVGRPELKRTLQGSRITENFQTPTNAHAQERVDLKAKTKTREGLIDEVPPASILIPKSPKKARGLKAKKLFIRLILILFLILIIGFSVWSFFIKKDDDNIPPDEPPVVIPPDETPTTTPEVIIPDPLIDVVQTEILELIPEANATSLFLSLLERDYPQKGDLVRVVIKDTENNTILGLKEFFNMFDIFPPEELIRELNNDFTIFVHPTEDANRLGFVAKATNEDGVEKINQIMLDWEPTIEKDTKNLFEVLGKETPAIQSYFRNAIIKETEFQFRYMTISKSDFGICYGIKENYFFFTTSFEGTKKATDNIPPDETPTTTPEVIIPDPLIDVVQTEILELIPEANATSLFLSLLERDYPQKGDLVRVVIKDTENNTILGLKEFFNMFDIFPSKSYLDKMHEEFTLFIYPTESANRLGFVTKVINEESAGPLNKMMNGWEKTIENDMKNLLEVLGKTDPAIQPTFKNTTFVNSDFSFRYMIISENDFGVCYAVTNDYLIFTTSLGGMEKIIKSLSLINN